MSVELDKVKIVVLDSKIEAFGPFYDVLSRVGKVVIVQDFTALEAYKEPDPNTVILLDVETVLAMSEDDQDRLRYLRELHPVGLLTSVKLEDYICHLRRWEIFQVGIKTNHQGIDDLVQFVNCLRNPMNGFGLSRYFYHTSEVYRASIRTLEDKHHTIEQVINHFATTGYEIHELYNVRLILEEVINNALFHAFKDDAGKDKYRIASFEVLADSEKVELEYGSSGQVAGFAITDNSGTLAPKTILYKIERQFSDESMFDENGRGLYLTLMLSSMLILNLQEKERTQLVALFDINKKDSNQPKPFMIHAIGSEDFCDTYFDPELD